MEGQSHVLNRFLFQHQSGDINYIANVDESEVRPFVVMANVYGIVQSSPTGVDLAVADHTRRAIFSLSSAAHWKFLEEHIRVYAPNEPITEPYAIGDNWNHNYLFLVNPSIQLTVMGHNAFAITDICMDKPVIDQFALYIFPEEEYREFTEVVSKIVPRTGAATNGAILTADHRATHPNNSVGFKKRVHGPYVL